MIYEGSYGNSKTISAIFNTAVNDSQFGPAACHLPCSLTGNHSQHFLCKLKPQPNLRVYLSLWNGYGDMMYGSYKVHLRVNLP